MPLGVGVAELEFVAEGVGQGGGAETAGGGELGARLEDARDSEGNGERAEAGGAGIDEGVEAERAEGAEDSGDMAVGAGADDGEIVLEVGDGSAALEQSAEFLDEVRGPLGEVEDGALADLGANAEGLAEKDGGGRVAVGDGLDIHGY